MSEPNDPRPPTGGLLNDVIFTLLFGVIATVSAVTLVRTLKTPLTTGALSAVQWALFAVTVVGATLGFVRSMRFYASLSVLAKLRRSRREEVEKPSDAEAPGPGMHPVVDHMSWGAITLAVAVINVLGLSAVVLTLVELVGDTRTPTGWVLWQLAVLVAALAGSVGLARAVAAELRDRSRRRRRNAVHVISNKLMHWPSSPKRASSARRRTGQAGAVAAAAVLAGVSWASASGPLLEPAAESGAVAGGAPAEQRAALAAGGPASRTAGAAAQTRAEASSRERRARARRAERESNGRDHAAVISVATPVVAPAPPPPVAPAPSAGQAPDAETQSKPDRPRKRPQRKVDRPRSAPAPIPTPIPIPTPTPPPIATPPPTPTPAPGPPCGQPPCPEGQGTPPPG